MFQKKKIKSAIRGLMADSLKGKFKPESDPHPILKVAAGKADIFINNLIKADTENKQMYYDAGLEVGREFLDKLGIKHQDKP